MALFQLQLKAHWPLIHTSALPEPTDPMEKWLLEHPQPEMAPVAPFHQVWCTEVRGETNREFTTWLAQTDHRAASYKTETLAGLPTTPSRDASAWWLTLPLLMQVQQLLLQLQALASDIATHTLSSHCNAHAPKPYGGRKRARQIDNSKICIRNPGVLYEPASPSKRTQMRPLNHWHMFFLNALISDRSRQA